jgi:heptaprenyl diphosphate synthase
MDKPDPLANEDHAVRKMAFLVSVGCVLQIAESLIPHPVAGLRLGLANIVTLIALATLNFRSALGIAVLRTILSSFMMGTFMSPAFILSFSAAFISTSVMGFFYWLSRFHKEYRLSTIGISIIGALTHNIAQLCVAFLLLVRHKGIFIFLPWLCIGAVFTGWITGVVAVGVCRSLKDIKKQKAAGRLPRIDYSAQMPIPDLSSRSFLRRIPPEIKIAGISIISLLVFLSHHFWVYAGLFFFLAVIVACADISLLRLLGATKRYLPMALSSFLLPVFFNSGSHPYCTIAHFKISCEGLNMGLFFVARMFFLILMSSLLFMTTSYEEMARGFVNLLKPLRIFGIPNKKIAGIFSYSWLAIPVFWKLAQETIRTQDFKKARNMRHIIPFFSDFIAGFYLETEKDIPVTDQV